jgi:rubrerythrin
LARVVKTLRAIAEQALLSELEAERMYLLALGKAKRQEVADILRYLLEAERSHIKTLSNLFDGLLNDKRVKFRAETFVHGHQQLALQKLSEKLGRAGIDEQAGAAAMLRFAIGEEVAAQRFYRRCMRQYADPLLKSIMIRLIEEEKSHETQLRELMGKRQPDY